HLAVVERPLPGHPRVTDEAGRATDEGDRPVPGELEGAQRDELDEAAVVEARRTGVEAAVVRDGSCGEGGADGVAVGGLGDEPAPLQLLEDVTHVCVPSWSVRTGRRPRALVCPVDRPRSYTTH